MKKWPSGRRRQTVNLLGNSRWFESNLFHNKKDSSLLDFLLSLITNLFRHKEFLVLKKKKIKNFLKKKQTFIGKITNHLVLNSNHINQSFMTNKTLPSSTKKYPRNLTLFFLRKNVFTKSSPLLSYHFMSERVNDSIFSRTSPGKIGLETFFVNRLYRKTLKGGLLILRLFKPEHMWLAYGTPSNLLSRSFSRFFFFYNKINTTLVLFFQKKINSTLTKRIPVYSLYWTFTKTHRLYINLLNGSDIYYNYISLSPGLFLKFYGQKRPLKRTKLFKVLLVKYLRKLLITSRLKDVSVSVNRLPLLFTELFSIFMTPEVVPYNIPNKNSLYNDDLINKNKSFFNVHRFYFNRTKFYGIYKSKLRGRLKRKVARRLTKKNNILD